MSTPSIDVGDESRLTLPPIRDLFREVLTRSSGPLDSPPLGLARLRVSDEVEEGHTSSYHGFSSQEHFPRTIYRSTSMPMQPFQVSRSHPNTSTPRTFGLYRENYRELPHPLKLTPPSSPTDYGMGTGTTSYGRGQELSGSQYSTIGNHLSFHSRSNPPLARHRSTISTADVRYDIRGSRYQSSERFSLSRHTHNGPTPHLQNDFLDNRSYRKPHILTSVSSHLVTDDDDRTPIARHRGPSGAVSNMQSNVLANWKRQEESAVSASAAKYECSFCGKGFNRPSSLKIHRNSHTGEKPFVCPLESCGRSFSVLSNMRRHARVHTQTSTKEKDQLGDEAKGGPLSNRFDRQSLARVQHSPQLEEVVSPIWQHRRNSSASTSSTSSRRSRSASSAGDVDEDVSRPEKRTRHYPT